MILRAKSCAAALALGLWSSAAEAAVRLCYPSVSSGLQVAAKEQEARALAISAWITAAGAHGQGYTSWRLAAAKAFNCAKRADGQVQCLARAEPCTISNVPPLPGEGVPMRRAPGIDG